MANQAKLIDGKAVSAAVKQQVAEEAGAFMKRCNVEIGLAVVIVGDDPASRIYVNNKRKVCEAVGFHSYEYALPADTSQDELMSLIDSLNADKRVNGILVQMPLPDELDENEVINRISPDKDVDAFHPVNVGRIMTGRYSMVPCTPAGVMELISAAGVEVSGKNCVVVGRSNIVGKPMAMLLLHKNGTVTICHSKTRDLAEICRQADILVAAVGRERFITADMIKEGACVIDVGINRMSDGRLCGDVDFEQAKNKAGYITPVPGGVGPMTIAMLMKNTLTAARLQNGDI